MKRHSTMLVLSVALALSGCLSIPWSPRRGSLKPTDVTPLDAVIRQVKASLDAYQANLGSGPDSLPSISSVDFDFKATTVLSASGTALFGIANFGVTREQDIVNDVTFTYTPPPPVAVMSLSKPAPLTEALASAIQSAAAAVKADPAMGTLQFSKLVVVVQFAVKWDVTGGLKGPISFLTAGISGDANKTSVQSVKITFGK